MDLDKSSLIKTILQKLRDYLKSQPCDNVLNDFSEIFKKCQFLKLRKLSNQLFYEIESEGGKVNELMEDFKLKILECCKNETLKNHIRENSNEKKHENICLSSDDEYESHKSESSLFSDEDPNMSNQKEFRVDSDDSDIEIIDAKETISGGAHYNMRKRKASNSKENINITDGERSYKQSRYEFRERKPNFFTSTANATEEKQRKSPSESHCNGEGGLNDKTKKDNNNLPQDNEVIQIEDSSSDEDVQEIRRESGSSNRYNQRAGYNNSFRNDNNHSFRPPRNSGKPSFKVNMSSAASDHPPTQADPSQLASIPLIVQFPTMQSATFNGHLYISHNHKFSVKLQGIDPRNFRWN